MFSSNKVSNVVENALKSNNKVNLEEADNSKLVLASILVGILIVIIINILVGPALWNNVLRRLVPSLGKARWYDTIALALLIGLLVPN
jgi:hypothetical protein|tara:strand:+ start:1329 stop:1592 length:264 start_codon:yes stop_codon:yes gene_type:complete